MADFQFTQTIENAVIRFRDSFGAEYLAKATGQLKCTQVKPNPLGFASLNAKDEFEAVFELTTNVKPKHLNEIKWM